MANIMVVDDEGEILDLVALYLQNAGHSVLKYGDPVKAMDSNSHSIDLAILDVMMPGMDGFAMCRALREQGHTFPIIMLTAKDGDNDKISGLVLGADDYVVKPFNPMELVARVSAQLRRVNKYTAVTDPKTIDVNGLVINEDGHTCTLYGKEVVLTPTEFAILHLLAKNRGKVMGSEQIFEEVWGEKYLDSNNTVMAHMQKLRKKLGDTGKKKKFIQTVWGVGYKIES